MMTTMAGPKREIPHEIERSGRLTRSPPAPVNGIAAAALWQR